MKQIILYLATPTVGVAEISGESWQLVMIKVMVWYFVRDTCKVMIALILVVFVLVFLELAQWLTSKCYFL